MIIQYIEKRQCQDGEGERVCRVDLRTAGTGLTAVHQDGALVGEGVIPADQAATLRAAAALLNDLPLFVDATEGNGRGTTRKLVFDSGRASFCFLWSGDLPREWIQLATVVDMIVDAATAQV